MKQKPSSTVLAMATATGIFLLGIWFLIAPQVSTITAQVQVLNKSVDAQTAMGATPAPAVSVPATVKESVDALLPSSAAQYDLSVQVEALSKNIGVTVVSVGFAATDGATAAVAPVPGVSALGLSMGVTGTYAQIQQLVEGLSSLDRFLQVTGVTISGASGATPGAANILTAQITGAAYYLPKL